MTRAIQLLDLVADHPNGISVGNLAKQSSLHKSTVSRLIITLEAAGAVQRVGKQSAVQIAPAFAQRLATHRRPNDLRTMARPFLEALSDRFGEATGLALPENDQAVFVDQVSPNLAIQVKDWTGARFPLHTVSPGKLFLAHRPMEAQEQYLSQPLAAYTTNTTTDPVQLRQAFAEIRQNGIAWIFDEFADGLSAVAAPIFDREQTILGALVLYAPSYRFPGAKKIEAINLIMIDMAARCSAEVQQQLCQNRSSAEAQKPSCEKNSVSRV